MRRPWVYVWGGLILVLTVYVVYRAGQQYLIRRELARVRAEGYPTTVEELRSWYIEHTPDQNAAESYVAAFDAYVEADREELLPFQAWADLPERSEPLAEDMKAAIAASLAANADTLAQLRAIPPEAPCLYPSMFDDEEMPHAAYRGARECTELLADGALLAAELDDHSEAYGMLMSLFTVCGSLHDSLDGLGQWVRFAGYGRGVEAASRVLSRTPLDPRQCRRLDSHLRRLEDTRPMVRATTADRCWASVCLGMSPDELEYYFNIEPPAWWWSALYRGSGLQDSCRIAVLDVMRRKVEVWELPLPDRFAEAERLEVESDEAIRFFEIFVQHSGGLNGGERYIHSQAGFHAKALAGARCMRMALAVEVYRQDTGDLPADLADLVPQYADAVLDDPFDGRPLRYMRLPKGYVIYSVGPDGADDAGNDEPDEGEQGTDITFKVER